MSTAPAIGGTSVAPAISYTPIALVAPGKASSFSFDPLSLCCSPCTDLSICGYMPTSWQEGLFLIACALNVAIFALAFFAGYYFLATCALITACVLAFASTVARQLAALQSIEETARSLTVANQHFQHENTTFRTNNELQAAQIGTLTEQNQALSRNVADLTTRVRSLETIDDSMRQKVAEFDRVSKALEQARVQFAEENGKLSATRAQFDRVSQLLHQQTQRLGTMVDEKAGQLAMVVAANHMAAGRITNVTAGLERAGSALGLLPQQEGASHVALEINPPLSTGGDPRPAMELPAGGAEPGVV